MKNYEKYAEKIKSYKGSNFCADFIRPIILKDDCDSECSRCQIIQNLWLLEENEEPEVDWSKVEADTPILVRHNERDRWENRHFAKYSDGKVYAWSDGRTSFTIESAVSWKYAKLAETEGAE